ncbi:EthD domain-containing protein [Desulfopila sp. IMCC35008]|uniref:EthD domain-containing protein n=1 Tax=Desulfopila sp. IMCC35008 TaxID=2653858 RepID=UPI0013D04D22|nr:EthD domain-containing protein [Desulfopila sp. IMCC35008]
MIVLCPFPMSRSEFQNYWLNHHGPLFKKFAATYKAVRYVQSHTFDTPLNESMQRNRGTLMDYDGVGEIWWQSEEDFLAAINSPEGQKLRPVFIEDEAKFVDMEKSSVFFTTEHVLVDEIKPQQPQNKPTSRSLTEKIIKVSVIVSENRKLQV